MTRLLGAVLSLILLFYSSLIAQTSERLPQVSNLVAVLTKTVETKSATAGDEITLRAISDVVVDGEIVIARGSKLTGRIAEVTQKSKEQPQTQLAFVIDKAVRKDGVEIPLQAIAAAIAAPEKDSLTADPTYGMMHSNEPKMVGSGVRGTSSSGGLSSSSNASSNAAVATAHIKGNSDEPTELNLDSQGAIGYEGVSITWRLMVPPPVTVITTKSKNLKLEAGTQMLLRMAPPRLPR